MPRIHEKDLLAFTMLETAKATEPYPNKWNFKRFGSQTGTKASDSSYFKVFRRIVDTLDTVKNYNLEEKARMLFMTSTPVDEDLLEEMRKIALVRVNKDNQITSYKAKEGVTTFQGPPLKLKRRKNGGRKEKKPHHPADENLEESDGEEVLGAVMARVENLEDSEGDQAVELAEDSGDSEDPSAEDMQPEAIDNNEESEEDSEDPLEDSSRIQKILDDADGGINNLEERQLSEEDAEEDSEGDEEIFDDIYGDLDENVPMSEELEFSDEIDEDLLLNEDFDAMEDLDDMGPLDERVLDLEEEDVPMDLQIRDFGDLDTDEMPETYTPSIFSDYPFDDDTVDDLLLENGDLGSLENDVEENMEPEDDHAEDLQNEDAREAVNEDDLQEMQNEEDIEDLDEPEDEDQLSKSFIDFIENYNEDDLLLEDGYEIDDLELQNYLENMDSDISLDDDIDLLSSGSLSDEATVEDSDEQSSNQVVPNTQDAPKRNLKRKLESRRDEPISKKRTPGGEHESWSAFHSYVNKYGNGNEMEKAILVNEALLKSITPEFPFSGREMREMMGNKVQVPVQKDTVKLASVPSFMRLNRFHDAWVKAQKLREKDSETVVNPKPAVLSNISEGSRLKSQKLPEAPEPVPSNPLGATVPQSVIPPPQAAPQESEDPEPESLKPVIPRVNLKRKRPDSEFKESTRRTVKQQVQETQEVSESQAERSSQSVIPPPQVASPESQDPESEDVKPSVDRIIPTPKRQNSGAKKSAVKQEIQETREESESSQSEQSSQYEISPPPQVASPESQDPESEDVKPTVSRIIQTPKRQDPRLTVKPELLDQEYPLEALVRTSATVKPETASPTDDTEDDTQDLKPVLRSAPRRAIKQEILDHEALVAAPNITLKPERLDSGYQESAPIHLLSSIKQEIQDQGYSDESDQPEDQDQDMEEEPITPKLLTNRFFLNLEAFFQDLQSNEFRGLLQRIQKVREEGETRGFRFTSDQLSIVIDICLSSMVKKSMEDEITRQSTLLPLMNEFLDNFLCQMKDIGCSKTTWAVTEHVNCQKKRISKEQRVSYRIVAIHFSNLIDNLMGI